MTTPWESKARQLDQEDELASLRSAFYTPQHHDSPCVYMCGNSLGLQCHESAELVEAEMAKWREKGAEGHFHGERPWAQIDEKVTSRMAEVVGARQDEVVCMNTLTVNLHLLMLAFYQPTKTRYKILMEDNAFCSDFHALASQLRFHGFDPEDGLIRVRAPEHLPASEQHYRGGLPMSSIEEALLKHKDSIALVLFSGVQFYSGQLFDLERLCKLSQDAGITIGLDLAHAVGNVLLYLHDWGADFACWCSYKYLNGGPGCIAGAFVHEKNFDRADLKRLDGWWGQKLESRFAMEPVHDPIRGAQAFQMSNPAVLPVVSLLGSLDMFAKAGMKRLRAKSIKLTAFLEELLTSLLPDQVTIITPARASDRGCQLSLLFSTDIEKLHATITDKSVICDVRRPNVMRIAPVPLYNSFNDVLSFVLILKDALDKQ